MRVKTLALAVVLVFAAAAVQFGQTRQQPDGMADYQMPPNVIVDILDAPSSR
jgi:hypothetical protein